MSTASNTPPLALRFALRSMLLDPAYPVALKSEPWVEAHLAQRDLWTEERTEQLIRLALRWVATQKEDVENALRKAVGTHDADRLWPRTRDSRAGVRAHESPPVDPPQERAMESIPVDPAEVTHGVESHADVTWSRILDQMNKAPYNTPLSKWERAIDWAKTGRVKRASTDPETFEVTSSKDKTNVYLVSVHGCACHNSVHGPSKWCYHMVAALLFDRYEKAMQPELFGISPSIDDRLAQEPSMSEPAETAYIPEPTSPVPQPVMAPPLTEADLHAQKQQIVRGLHALGLKLATKADFEEAVMLQTGLVLAPDHYPLIIERLASLTEAREQARPPKARESYMVDIKGKPHLQYRGLLAMAHEKGLVSLTATFTEVTPTFAVALATATFANGQTFTECGEATPDNVGPQVKLHFARMALTRAKARALRDALNIGEVIAEEVE